MHLLRGPKDKVRIMETHWVSGRRRGEKDPQELPTCLSPPLFPVSLPMSGTASSPGRRQQAELGSRIPFQHRSPEPALQVAPAKAALLPRGGLLCQNLKPTQGDAVGVGITPVIAMNKEDLGSHVTETK